jgi:putative membrane protein
MEYLWLKALHVTAVLIFIGGLFMQAIGVSGGARGQADTVNLVSRWDQRVTMPAMLAVWLTGALVASSGLWFSHHWLWVKLVFVMALSGLHGVQAGRLRRLKRGDRLGPGASSFGVPATVACAVAVIAVLAVVKPF